MPKPNKSSATSNTRKKQASKKAVGDDGEAKGKQKFERYPAVKGLTKAQRKALKENRPKVYIPPPRPPVPARPDPLDAQGLARTLPAELVVVLRRLGKKDAVTKRKGIDELKDNWVDVVVNLHTQKEEDPTGELAVKEDALTEALPVWLHHLPSLLLSPSHRAVSLQLHTKLLKIPNIKSNILNTLALGLLPGHHHGRDVLGSWMTAAVEEGRRGTVGAGEEAMAVWEGFVEWQEDVKAEDADGTVTKLSMAENLEILVDYLRLAVLDPQELYRQVHPPPVKASEPPPPVLVGKKGAKGKGSQSQTPKGYFTPPPETEPEETEEDVIALNERNTRYQMSGLVGLAYLLRNVSTETLEKEYFVSFLSDPQLWRLFTTPANSTESTDVAAPPVRQALYEALLVLSTRHESYMRSKLFATAGPVFLRNIWTEADASVWSGRAVPDAVVAFLTKFKEIWLYEENDNDEQAEQENDAEDSAGEAEEGESDSEDGDEGQTIIPDGLATDSEGTTLGQIVYRDFLAYLQRACNGSPFIGYQFVLVVVSTIPETLLPHNKTGLETLCTSLWAAQDARLLPAPTNFAPSAFYNLVGTILDCIVLLNIRSAKTAAEVDTEAQASDDMGQAVAAQMGRVWNEGVIPEASKVVRMTRMVGAEKNTDVYKMAANVGSTIGRLEKVTSSTADKALDEITRLTTIAFSPPQVGDGERPSSTRSNLIPRLQMLLEALEQGYSGEEPRIKAFTNQISLQVAIKALQHIKQYLSANETTDTLAREDYPKMLAHLLEKRGVYLLQDETFNRTMQDLLIGCADTLLRRVEANLTAPMYIRYIKLLPAEEARQAWQQLSHAAANSPRPAKFTFTTALLVTFMDPEVQVSPEGTMWGDIAVEAGEEAISPNKSAAEAVELIRSLMINQSDLIGRDNHDHLLVHLTTALSHRALTSQEELLSEEDQSSLRALLDMLGPAIGNDAQHILQSDIHRSAFPQIFWLAFLAPTNVVPQSMREQARQVWKTVCSGLSGDSMALLGSTIRSSVLSLILDTETVMSPYDLLDALAQQESSDVCVDLGLQIGPESLNMASLAQSVLETNIQQTPSWIVDPLFPYERVPASKAIGKFDNYGRSEYARAMEALVYHVHSDITAIKTSAPSVLQIMLASRIAADCLDGLGTYGVYREDIDRQYLKSICREAGQITSYAVSSLAADLPASWHQAAMSSVTKGNPQRDTLSMLIHDLATPNPPHTVHLRCLRDLLDSILRSAEIPVSERWLAFATTLDSRPDLALAIMASVNRSLEKSPRLDRVRNEIASRLSGVTVKNAATEGLKLLRILNTLTPGEDSEDIILPQQRTVFLMQHLNGWLVSEDEAADDIPEELEARIALLYSNLAPIVQDVAGAHWESIFDMISSNFEVVTFADEETYNLMFATLSLLESVQKLVATNKSLRAAWTDKPNHIRAVAQLLLTVQPGLRRSSTTAALLDKVIDILDSSDDIAFFDSMEKVYPLLSYADLPVQRSLYHILRKSIQIRTAALVVDVEADLTSAAERLPELPEVLLSLAGQAQEHKTNAGNLLAWLLIFEHFVGASNTLRSAYIDQLRNADLVSASLMTFVPTTLRSVYSNNNSASDRYSVDQYYVEYIEDGNDDSLAGLRIHVFYRALETMPTLVRAWYESCKDRQLTMTFMSAVTKHFSPILISNEFAVLRQPGAISELEDDNLTIKVVSGAPEVNARYLIDEQPMEILIRLPAEFPLKSVEVKDLGRVGVTENKWRGWIFNLQQMIMSRNGLILEGLKVFKNNVTLHFEGKTECSICYSIIQMNDRSLPSRTCPTCKNKYHSNCLLQWFKSSSSSSCPMCRGLF